MQVVRVEDVKRLFPVTTELEDGQLWAVTGDLANEFRVGDVIELTEEPSNPNQTNVRWVSKWVVVDDD